MYKRSSRYQQRLRAHRLFKDSLPEGPSEIQVSSDGWLLLSSAMHLLRQRVIDRKSSQQLSDNEIVQLATNLAKSELAFFVDRLSDEEIDKLIEVEQARAPLDRDLRTSLVAALEKCEAAPINLTSTMEEMKASRTLQQKMTLDKLSE